MTAYAEVAYVGNGTTKEFNITFPYIEETHVKVTLNTVATTGFVVDTTTTPNKITFNTLSAATSTQETTGAPKTSVDIVVYRETPLNAALVDYTDGSTLIADDLDTSNKQWLYALQEQDDVQSAGIQFTPQGLDANNNRVINVANPVSPQDAATKNYVDTSFLKKDGSVAMTGALQLGNNKITGLAAGTAATDAVIKSQLDTGISTATTAQTAAAASATAAAASQTAAAASATAAAASQTAAAASATTAANLTRSTVFIGFQRQTDGDLRMYWNNSSFTGTFAVADFEYKGEAQWLFGGDDLLATTGNNAPKFSLNSAGHLLLDIP